MAGLRAAGSGEKVIYKEILPDIDFGGGSAPEAVNAAGMHTGGLPDFAVSVPGGVQFPQHYCRGHIVRW
jgi:hypothetical protein